MARVLLIDDAGPGRERVRAALADAGHAVVVASTAAEACERRAGCAIVLANIHMPQKEGLEAVRLLHQVDPGMRIVALAGGPAWPDAAAREATGPSGSEVQEMARSFGAWRILPAPFEWGALAAALREAVGAGS